MYVESGKFLFKIFPSPVFPLTTAQHSPEEAGEKWNCYFKFPEVELLYGNNFFHSLSERELILYFSHRENVNSQDN